MLYVPNCSGGSFADIQGSHEGVRPPTGELGTELLGAVHPSYGGYTEVIASTRAESFGVLINFNNRWVSANHLFGAVDIAIGAVGQEIVIIPNLMYGPVSSYGPGQGYWYYFPIKVPAGSRISARHTLNNITNNTLRMVLRLLQKPSDGTSVKAATFVESIGATLPTGTNFTPGTTLKGAWTLLGAATRKVWWWQVGVKVASGDTNHVNATAYIDLAVGDASQKHIVLRDHLLNIASTEVSVNRPQIVGSECAVPAGTNVYVRGQSSGTAETYAAVAYAAGG
ncbi:hypothetical protein [Hydrogenophaga defluvii]|uniref:Uncharacterized protein n=1 Tax=Hydrogenophaga defluvii TaxID=249410 RepID=A0ABW2SC13_9BURK